MLIIALLPLLASPAHAWKHSGYTWPTPDLGVCIRDAGLGAEWIPEARDAISTWDAVLAAEVGGSLTEVFDCDAPGVLVVELGGDGPDTSGLAIVAHGGFSAIGETRDIDGCTYTVVDGYVGHVPGLVDFGSHEEIAGGQCSVETNLRATVAHVIGHGLGLGHSCDEGEPCTGPELVAALMHWTSTPCEVGVEPMEDDVAGLRALYGPEPSCGVEASSDGSGTPQHPDLPPHEDDAAAPGGCGCVSANGGQSSTPLWLLLALLVCRRR